MLGVRIPDHDVGIASRRELAFARIQAEQARGRGRNQLDKAIQAELA